MKSTKSSQQNSALPLVTLIGGNGFLGRHTARLLLQRGWHVRVASRKAISQSHRDSTPEIEFVHADILDAHSLADALEGASAVVNLTGILSPTRTQNFDQVHCQGAQMLAAAAAHKNITNFVHISAIGAEQNSPSSYARSKKQGENVTLSIIPEAIILRPSIIFGPEDNFFNRFALMARFSPALPLIGGGQTLFQPVFVDDVAESISLALAGKARQGTIYELGGPERRRFSDLLRYIGTITKRRRLLLPLPFPLAEMMALGIEALNVLCFGHMPEMLLITRDQVNLLRRDNIVSDEAVIERRTLEGLGISPQLMSSIVPTYLTR